MSRRGALAVSSLEYRETASRARAGLHLVSLGMNEQATEESVVVEQLRRELSEVRDRSTAEAEMRTRGAVEAEREAMMRQVAVALERFEQERKRYFSGVEQEVVRLSLGIAKKILQREAELDPTLLAALVRIALERMEAGSDVRIRVRPEDAGRWRAVAGSGEDRASWMVVEDAMLTPGDCIVETAMGKANFGFESQLADVETTMRQLLMHRPEAA